MPFIWCPPLGSSERICRKGVHRSQQILATRNGTFLPGAGKSGNAAPFALGDTPATAQSLNHVGRRSQRPFTRSHEILKRSDRWVAVFLRFQLAEKLHQPEAIRSNLPCCARTGRHVDNHLGEASFNGISMQVMRAQKSFWH